MNEAVEVFWEKRDLHAKAIAAKLVEVQDLINEGVDANLYRDGLSNIVMQVKNSVTHLAVQLDPSLAGTFNPPSMTPPPIMPPV